MSTWCRLAATILFYGAVKKTFLRFSAVPFHFSTMHSASFILSRLRGMAPVAPRHFRSSEQSYICAMFISFFPGEERNEPKKEVTDQ